MLSPYPRPWLGGEPRVLAVDVEDNFPERFPSASEARLIDLRYEGGGLNVLLESIAVAADVETGSFQAVL